MESRPPGRKPWTHFMADEDLAFIKRFIFASGSLKEVAAGYGVTYPTVRLRLDRLIAKLQIFDSQEIADDFERTLRGQFADGKLDAATFKLLLATYQQQQAATTQSIPFHATESPAA
jgi:hypothetical protein